MIILCPDGSLMTESAPERVVSQVKDTIDVPEDLVARQPELFDRIFTYAFDVLGLQTIDLRIRPMSLGSQPEVSCTVACT